jgi:hypothetical protein
MIGRDRVGFESRIHPQKLEAMTRAAATALTLLLASAACGTAGPTARQSVVLRPDIPSERIAALRADPRIATWTEGEEIVAVCEPERDRTLVITTHRHMRLRPGWQTPEMQGTFSGAETVSREETGRRSPRLVLTTQTALIRSGNSIIFGSCDADQLEDVVTRVVRLRAGAGDADALLARHDQLRERDVQRAEEARRREQARMGTVDLHSPPIDGLTWNDLPQAVRARRAQFEAFAVEPRDLVWANRQQPHAGDMQWSDCRSAMGHAVTCTLNAPEITYGGACRALAVATIPGYQRGGRTGVLEVVCRNDRIRVNISVFERGVVELRQERRSGGAETYRGRAALALFTD